MLRKMLHLLAAVVGLMLLPAAAQADGFRVGAFERGTTSSDYELIAAVPNVLSRQDPLGLSAAAKTPRQPDGAPQARSLPQVAAYYTGQGVMHILGGWDHLCFVLCLCLLARGRFLLALVTTFTLGHSLSLGLAFFDVIHVPVLPVEVVIALSIAFMAREALRAQRNGLDQGPDIRRRQIAVVGGFGLLHGLGFAAVLRELGVVPGERASGLLFFNAGVELGQLLFVGAVLGAMGIAGAFGQREPVRRAALYFAGLVGCFWAIERVAGVSLGIA